MVLSPAPATRSRARDRRTSRRQKDPRRCPGARHRSGRRTRPLHMAPIALPFAASSSRASVAVALLHDRFGVPRGLTEQTRPDLSPGTGVGFAGERLQQRVLFLLDPVQDLRVEVRGVLDTDPAVLRREARRERVILNEIADAFSGRGGTLFLPLRFWMEDQRRISHHLLLVSKNFRGYHLMKEIMAPESASEAQGVPSFEYNPRDYSMLPSFELYQPLDELEKRLLADLGGRTLTMNQIYERPQRQQAVHQEKNYKQALQALYARGAIE